MQCARRPSSPPSTHLTVLMPGSRRDEQTVAGSASVRPCRRRVLDRLPGVPGRRGRPDRVPGCACPADRWTGDRTSGRRVVPARWARGAGRRRCSPSSSGAPEFNQFVIELASVGGFRTGRVPGTVDSILASVDPLVQGRCALRRPRVCRPRPGRRGGPLVAPSSRYPWLLSWRAGDSSEHVRALVDPASSPAGPADRNPAPARD